MMKNYRETDPEFVERVEHFAFDEVVNEPGQQLDEVTRHMAILATLLGCQGTDVFRRELPQALDVGVTPVMAKEIVYQAVDYLGMGRVLPFLDITNEVLTARGVALRAGLHCAPTAHESAGTLQTGTLRASFGPDASPEQTRGFLQAASRLWGGGKHVGGLCPT